MGNPHPGVRRKRRDVPDYCDHHLAQYRKFKQAYWNARRTRPGLEWPQFKSELIDRWDDLGARHVWLSPEESFRLREDLAELRSAYDELYAAYDTMRRRNANVAAGTVVKHLTEYNQALRPVLSRLAALVQRGL